MKGMKVDPRTPEEVYNAKTIEPAINKLSAKTKAAKPAKKKSPEVKRKKAA